MGLELMLVVILALVVVGAMLKRVVWLAVVSLIVLVLLRLGVFDILIVFVKQTLLVKPPINITFG